VRRRDAGASLLEVIVALTILVTAGTAALAMASQVLHAVERARLVEAEFRAANAFFEAVALWTRDDLDRRLGERRQGAWRLRIDRPTPTLYVAVLRDSLGYELLRTSFHRPEPKPEEHFHD
jgi:type II secretory pathway pseudopilin PulG